jgi:vacuolar protein sorting-associated protein VTA1
VRFHIVQKIIGAGLHSADQACTAYTTGLMEQLEQTKADMPGEDALLDDVAASAYCEQFALQTFAKADRDMNENKVTATTADTLMAASTFLDMLSIWKKDDPELAAKIKYAKYHALRIIKAIKAGDDPNATNPVQDQEQQPPSPPLLDPTDPEVQRINDQSAPQPLSSNPYQSYVESAPNTDAQPSPTFSAPKVSPPPNLPTVPTGYTSNTHDDVSPISQPATSRQGSVVSVGGGYFPRTDAPPTFTSDNTAPSLPTAPSTEDDPLTSSLGGLGGSTSDGTPQASRTPDPSTFYQNPASPPGVVQPPQQPSAQSSAPQNPYASPPSQHQYPAPSSQPLQHSLPAPQSVVPSQQYSPMLRQNPYAQPSAPPPPAASSQGPFRSDEESIMQAQKHAKWAISALNFEDSATAVKELRIALQALGAH